MSNFLFRRLSYGEKVPSWMALVRTDLVRLQADAVLVPFHWPVRGALRLWYWVRSGKPAVCPSCFEAMTKLTFTEKKYELALENLIVSIEHSTCSCKRCIDLLQTLPRHQS